MLRDFLDQRARWRVVGAGLMVCALTLSSCGLIPRSGPSKNEIFAGSVQREGDAFIITVNDRINRAAAVTPAFGFSEAFLSASTIGSDIIRPGDTLSLTIWENVDNPLLGGTGQGAATLGEVQVDGAGFIFVPYAGRIRASGSAPESIRQTITQRLSEQTPDPQVEVRRLAGDGSTVSIVGDAVGGQGIFPIERPTRTLSAMLAQAGGITTGPDVAQVTVIRGDQSGTIWFQDLFDDPRLDISLRGGDRIIVQEDSRSFTALGATGSQSRVTFDSQTISAIEAIATVGGLSSNVADPQGVFVLRNEPAEIARAVTGRGGLQGDQRVAYVLDLTQPNGMFMARDFAIRDGDTVYVTEAPIVTWNKTISAITGSLGNVNSLANTVSGG